MLETNRRLKIVACLLAISCPLPGGSVSAGEWTNIVLLFADDLGWTDLGCFGSRYYETPRLDRLAAEGMKFTSAYSNAGNCAPSRACLLSGQYVPRHGVYTVGNKKRFDSNPRLLKWDQRKLLAVDNAAGLDPSKVTMAEALQMAGYRCGMFGKWHLGTRPDQLPSAQGFDVAIAQTGGTHFEIRTMPPPAKPLPPGTYRSDYMTDRALEFIESSRDRPFFLYLPDYLVHVPLEAKEELIAKYRRKPAVGGHRNPVYAAMVENLDANFGRVLDKLDELDLADNTLVVFFSDNGGVGGRGNRGLDPSGGITSNAPLRGTKGMLYEGGIRVPMIARWPGPVAAGSVCHQPVIGIDLYATFLDVAGAAKPRGQTLDGASLLSLMAGTANRLERDSIFWHMPGYLPGRQAPATAMRSGDFKLIEHYEDGSLELFNLRDDIGERNDLSSQDPARVAELHERLKAWRDAIGARIPKRNPSFDPRNEGRS